MAIKRYPYSRFDRMFEQMRRAMLAMDPMASDFEGTPALGPRTSDSDSWSMSRGDSNLTLEETDDGFVVVADLPGFESEEIDLRFDDGHLSIDAEHTVDESSDGISRSRSRRVREQVLIPGDVVADDISARYHNGVLEVDLPVSHTVDEDSTRIDID